MRSSKSRALPEERAKGYSNRTSEAPIPHRQERAKQTLLNEDQRKRYERNTLIPGFGPEGQERLQAARVLIVGLGGLGSPASLYLAMAGVGTLGLMDSDTVELSNLQRQMLHGTPDIGSPKSKSAKAAIQALDPAIHLELLQQRLTPENARQIIGQFDVVVEACDNFQAKFLINDTCLELNKPFTSAGILSMSGQALFVVPGQSPCLRCITPKIPQGVPTTSELGVLGAVPGILGSLEAMEIIRWLIGKWKRLPDGRGLLHSVDGETMRLRTMHIPRRQGCRCGH